MRPSSYADFLAVGFVLRRQGINAGVLVVGDPFRRGRFEQDFDPPAEPTDRLSKPPATQTRLAAAQGGLNIPWFEDHAGQTYVLPTPVVMNSPCAPVLVSANPMVRIFSGNFDLNVEFQPRDFQGGGDRCQHVFCLAAFVAIGQPLSPVL